MDRITATTWAVSTGLVALLVSALASAAGGGEAVVLIGLVAAPVVAFFVYRELRS